MKSKILIFTTLSILFLSACNSPNTNTPSSTNNLPKGETVAMVDFQGDGNPEQVIKFTEDNFVHIDVISQDGKTVLVDKQYPMDDFQAEVPDSIRMQTMPAQEIKSISKGDLGNDGREELLIVLDFPKDKQYVDTYDLIQYVSGTFKGLQPPDYDARFKGVLDVYGKMMDVAFVGGKLVETWGGLCEDVTDPCYTYQFELTETSTQTFTASKAKNIQKVEDKWAEYDPEGTQWHGELPF